MRFAIRRILLLCGVIQSVLTVSDIIPPDYFNMTCSLADNTEGICVYAYLCNNDVVNTDGTAILDLRFSDECEDYFLKCCSKQSPCMEKAGTCVPENRCFAKLDTSKYKKFKESDECDWSGYQCCPNEAVSQETTSTDRTDISEDGEANCDVDSICVPDDQCMVNADGADKLEARMSICSGSTTCCPRNEIKKNISNSCESIGGQCIQKGKCKSHFSIDVRTTRCADPEFECCMDDNQPTATQKPSLEGKKCFLNRGICTPRAECRGPVYTDRKEECGDLVCCPHSITTTISGEQSTTEQPNDITCDSLGGTCEADRDCQRKAAEQSVDCAEGTVCCLSKGSREVTSVKPGSAEYTDIRDCGYRNEDGFKFSTVNRTEGEAQYGEFPWMVAILVNDLGKVKPHCAGTLIDPGIVLTTADCVRAFKRKSDKLIIRAGEWDMGATMEPIPHQERRVSKMKIHATFNHYSLVNNIALLFLDDKFDLTPTINTICLPPQDFTIDNGYVTATGWGTTPQNRTKYQQILKSIDLPYNEKSSCEHILRRAMRIKDFKLDSSFICAGGEHGIDTCQGDAGSPLIFPIPDASDLRYYAVGMVSWGVGCGRSGVPSVYTAISNFRTWIEEKIEEEELHTQFYEYQPQEE